MVLRRAVRLHVAIVLWVPICLVAGWWQVTRAFDGNGLSYLYSVEWPLFAIVGVWGWWQLIHIDPETVGHRAQERMARAAEAAAGDTTEAAAGTPTTGQPPSPVGAGTGTGGAGEMPPRRLTDEDEELAAYNERLAALAEQGPQTWRNR